MLFVRLFGLCLFRFVGFLFLLGSGKGCGLWLWHSLDFPLTFFPLLISQILLGDHFSHNQNTTIAIAIHLAVIAKHLFPKPKSSGENKDQNPLFQPICSSFYFWALTFEKIDWLCWGLTTCQPLWVILCRLPEKGRKETEETAEEMKEERDREERGTEMKVKKQKK